MTDSGPTQPIAVAPGSEFGQRQALTQMQQAQPLPASPLPLGPADPELLQPAAVEAAGQMGPMPEGGLMHMPTARPDEALTAGLDIGPGPGPEAIPGQSAAARRTHDQIARAAEITGNPALVAMARRTRRPIGRRLPESRPFR